MLTIRDEQLQVFAKAARSSLRGRLAEHLRRHFPAVAAGLADGALRARIESALDDAAGYGLTAPRDQARYLNLVGAYGWGFDRAPSHAWMRCLLLDDASGAPGDRLDALVAECLGREAVAAERRRLYAAHGQRPREEAP